MQLRTVQLELKRRQDAWLGESANFVLEKKKTARSRHDGRCALSWQTGFRSCTLVDADLKWPTLLAALVRTIRNVWADTVADPSCCSGCGLVHIEINRRSAEVISDQIF